MPRATNAPASRERRKRVVDAARGYRGRRSKLFRYAKDATMKAKYWAYRDRKTRKRNFRMLWVQRLNAAVRAQGLNHPQARQEAGIGGQLGAPAVVGVPVMNSIAEHYFGLVAPNGSNERQLMLRVVAEKPVGQTQVFARAQPQHQAGRGGFGGPNSRGAAGAQFPPREVNYSNFLACSGSRQHSARTRHFHIVGVRPQGQNIKFHKSGVIANEWP